MMKKLKSNKYAKQFGSKYINVFGILLLIINLDGSKTSNYLSLISLGFLCLSLWICTDLEKLEVFDSGFKLIIALAITSFIEINSDVLANNISLFIFIFAFEQLPSLNIDFNSKYFEIIFWIRFLLNVTICSVFFVITANEYLYKDFDLYVNLLNGICIVGIGNLLIDSIRICKYTDYSIRNGKERDLGIKMKFKNKVSVK